MIIKQPREASEREIGKCGVLLPCHSCRSEQPDNTNGFQGAWMSSSMNSLFCLHGDEDSFLHAVLFMMACSCHTVTYMVFLLTRKKKGFVGL